MCRGCRSDTMTHYDTSSVGGVGVCRRCRSDTMTQYDTAARGTAYDTRVRVSESVGGCQRMSEVSV